MRALRLFDASTIVSGSTDNSFKLWDLSMNQARVIDNPIQTSTGHINTKTLPKVEEKWRRTPTRDVHIIMNDGQLIGGVGVLCDSGIAGGCRESSLIHVHCPLCISVMLSYFSQQEDAFVYVHCL
uniref:Uncharacterized protein n=2 Tax=Triticum urartu TaxID=4572 RepID=A0A8R7V1H9_TRIUA